MSSSRQLGRRVPIMAPLPHSSSRSLAPHQNLQSQTQSQRRKPPSPATPKPKKSTKAQSKTGEGAVKSMSMFTSGSPPRSKNVRNKNKMTVNGTGIRSLAQSNLPIVRPQPRLPSRPVVTRSISKSPFPRDQCQGHNSQPASVSVASTASKKSSVRAKTQPLPPPVSNNNAKAISKKTPIPKSRPAPPPSRVVPSSSSSSASNRTTFEVSKIFPILTSVKCKSPLAHPPPKIPRPFPSTSKSKTVGVQANMSQVPLQRPRGKPEPVKSKSRERKRSVTPVTHQFTWIHKTVEKILEFLPVKDLKSCRLVNKFWEDLALERMREKGILRFAPKDNRPIDRGLWLKLLKKMKRFLKCFREVRGDIPCTKFEIFTKMKYSRIRDAEKSILANFLQAISPWVTEITWIGENIGGLLNGMEKLKFPSLKHVFILHIFDDEKSQPTFSPWMSIFITNAPQLEKLDFTGIGFHPLKAFFQVLKHNQGQWLKIKDLRISAPIENNDLINLSECGLKLKSLILRNSDFNNQEKPVVSLPQLLKSQSENLENFSIKNLSYKMASNVPFPILKKLTSLTMGGLCPGLINYAEQMPSLSRVVFENVWIDPRDWPKYLNGGMKPVPGVKELRFRRTSPTKEAMREAVRIFPNITKLEFRMMESESESDLVPIVYDSLPNLEELTLDISFCLRVDELLTGLTKERCQDANEILRDWTPDFDDSSIQIGINHSPISVLKKLKLLRVKYFPRLSKREGIGAVSLCLVLMKMPSLKILDLYARYDTPANFVSSTVLEEFQKNCLMFSSVVFHTL